MPSGHVTELDEVIWTAYQVPCSVCGTLVYTRLHPASPGILRAVCGYRCYVQLPQESRVIFDRMRDHERPRRTEAAAGVTLAELGSVIEHPPVLARAEVQLDSWYLPTGAKRIGKTALAHGWQVVITYAKGMTKGTAQHPSRQVITYALRMRRGAEYVVAVWENGRYATGVDVNALRTLGNGAKSELKARLVE